MEGDDESRRIIINLLRGLNATEKEMTGHLLSEMLMECYYGQVSALRHEITEGDHSDENITELKRTKAGVHTRRKKKPKKKKK